MPNAPPLPTAAEGFAAFVRWLFEVVVTVTLGRTSHATVASPLLHRLKAFRDIVAHVAERVASGKYRPRPPSTQKRKAPLTPPKPPKLPDPACRKFGWLAEVLKERAPGCRGQFSYMLQAPGMQALMETAPATMRRPINSICWMLGMQPPAVLARPKKPRPPREKKPRPKPEKLPSRPPTPPDSPPWMHNMPPSIRLPSRRTWRKYERLAKSKSV
jgi:hypothetical protein